MSCCSLLLCAGRLSDDCTLHVADAVAVDKLMKALRNQTQLEAVNIQIQGPWLPSPDQGVYSGMEDAHYAEYKCASKITAQLFIPVWKSACNLFKHGQMFQLRYEQACFVKIVIYSGMVNVVS